MPHTRASGYLFDFKFKFKFNLWNTDDADLADLHGFLTLQNLTVPVPCSLFLVPNTYLPISSISASGPSSISASGLLSIDELEFLASNV